MKLIQDYLEDRKLVGSNTNSFPILFPGFLLGSMETSKESTARAKYRDLVPISFSSEKIEVAKSIKKASMNFIQAQFSILQQEEATDFFILVLISGFKDSTPTNCLYMIKLLEKLDVYDFVCFLSHQSDPSLLSAGSYLSIHYLVSGRTFKKSFISSVATLRCGILSLCPGAFSADRINQLNHLNGVYSRKRYF